MSLAIDNENVIHASESVLGLVGCVRLQKGRLVEEKILVKFDQIEGNRVLTILSEWSRKNRCWGMVRTYLVRETETDFPGRAFRLDRGYDAIEDEPVETYSTFISSYPEQPDICDCRGAQCCPQCKHAASIKFLLGICAL